MILCSIHDMGLKLLEIAFFHNGFRGFFNRVELTRFEVEDDVFFYILIGAAIINIIERKYDRLIAHAGAVSFVLNDL